MDSSAHANRLTHSERLRGQRSIDPLFEGGESGFVHPFRYVWQLHDTPRAGVAPVAVLFSAPKRNHKRAVKRNILKRRTREAYRLNNAPLVGKVREGGSRRLSLALVYSSKEIENFKTIEDALRRIIARICPQL